MLPHYSPALQRCSHSWKCHWIQTCCHLLWPWKSDDPSYFFLFMIDEASHVQKPIRCSSLCDVMKIHQSDIIGYPTALSIKYLWGLCSMSDVCLPDTLTQLHALFIEKPLVSFLPATSWSDRGSLSAGNVLVCSLQQLMYRTKVSLSKAPNNCLLMSVWV